MLFLWGYDCFVVMFCCTSLTWLFLPGSCCFPCSLYEGDVCDGRPTICLATCASALYRIVGTECIVSVVAEFHETCNHTTKLGIVTTGCVEPTWVYIYYLRVCCQSIAIDEAQFFSDLVEFCKQAADRDGKTVYVAGLDGDFNRLPFTARRGRSILQLVPLSDSVDKYLARCRYCSANAPFTFRTVKDDREILVGGADMYVPVCRKHYIEKWDEQQKKSWSVVFPVDYICSKLLYNCWTVFRLADIVPIGWNVF